MTLCCCARRDRRSAGSPCFTKTHTVVIMPSQPCRFLGGFRSGRGGWSLVAPGWRPPTMGQTYLSYLVGSFSYCIKVKSRAFGLTTPSCESNTDSSKSASPIAGRPARIRVCVQSDLLSVAENSLGWAHLIFIQTFGMCRRKLFLLRRSVIICVIM